MSSTAISFDRALWTPPRALAFARGLYHVAASDGTVPEETRLLSRFLEATGAPSDLEALISTPFDFTEARRELDSHWLRRLMVRACRILAELDGGLTDGERDALRAMALGLGVGERLALAPAERGAGTFGDIVAWVSAQPVDWVSWDDEAQRGTFWVFPAGDVPLAAGAKLMVSRGQALVFSRDQAVLDILADGVHEADPATLPLLAAAEQWTDGPVRARMTFVSLSATDMLRWGSVDPIPVPAVGGRDGEQVPLRAFGRFSVRIADAHRAFVRFCRSGPISTEEFESRVRRMAAGRFGEALRELAQSESWGAERMLKEPSAVIDRARPAIERAFAEAGLAVRRFELESLTGPLELELRTTGGGRMLQTGAFSNSVPSPTATPAEAALSCHRCLNAVPPNARFCAQCGAPQRKACAGCAADVSIRAKFCPQCGTAQSGSGPT